MSFPTHYQKQLARTLNQRTGLCWSPQKTADGIAYTCAAVHADYTRVTTFLDGFFAPFITATEADTRGIRMLTMSDSNATRCMQEYAQRIFSIGVARESAHAQGRG